MIDNFIRDSNRHWISDQRLYAPTRLGGLNCIELNSFFMALQMNWFKRYINNKYKDYWTAILDQHLKVSLNTRKRLLKYGSEYFSPLIWSCNFEIIRNMIKNLQAFLREFVTEPESGDKCFNFQSSFHNTNIREGGMKKKEC